MIRPILLLALLSGLSCSITAQKKMNTYDAEWKKAESLWHEKGLPESALTEVRKIYSTAAKENNPIQQVKALLYMAQLTAVNTEDADLKQLEFLEKQLPGAKEPIASLLQNMTATAYWQYFQEHRWEIRDRTNVANPGEDIATWPAATFQQRIHEHFRQSLADRAYLQMQSLDAYQPLITKPETGKDQVGTTALRPTLYDLLAHAALRYYTQEESFGMPRPLGHAGMPRLSADNAGQDFLLDSLAFAPADQFAGHLFKAEDSASLHFQALLLFQELTRFHLRDKQPEALIDLELQRLQFAREMSNHPQKDALYSWSLVALELRHATSPAIAQAVYLWVQQLYEDANERQANKAPADPALLPALAEACGRVIRTYPRSEGANNCARLLQSLQKKSFSMQVEQVNVPGKPFRMRIAYKNIDALHYRVIALTESMLASLRRDETYWNLLRSAPVLRNASQSLPAFSDLREHSAEAKVDGLEPGYYAILASADPSFSTEKNPLAVALFHVSNIACIHQQKDFFVLHRETGKPLAGADVRVMQQTYDYTSRKYLTIQVARVRSGTDGFFRMPYLDAKQEGQTRLDIRHGNDRLYLDEGAYYYYDNSADDAEERDRTKYEAKHERIFLFTDRGIYRPGQPVYFKGILMTRDFDTKRYKIVPDANTTVFLHDTEGQETDSVKVRTNAFGSYAGEFRLPQTVMTGEWSIEDETHEGQAGFQVEEYKRPTFYVEPAPLKGFHRLGDSITVQGTAMAYASAARNDAEVRYRVTRQVSFPFPWLARFYPYRYEPPVEIAHGVTRTGEDGKFRIPFTAIPDPKLDPKSLPVFQYEVSAEVTDAGGETRSMSTTVPVGYHALNLGASLPDNAVVATNGEARIALVARNLSGEPLSQQVTLTVIPVPSPGRLIRPRLWPAPDTVVLTEQEFLQAFPNDPYREEDLREHWTRGNPIARQSDTIRQGSGSIVVPMKGRAPGWYLAETIATDPFGQEVRNETWFYHASDAKAMAALPHYLESRVLPATYKPGDQARIQLSTSLPELWVIRSLHGAGEAPKLPQEGKISDPKKAVAMEDPGHPYLMIKLSAGETDQSVDIRESDLGGLGVSHITVMHNRIFTAEQSLSVPWTMKELDVSLTTFRAKTEPGAKESWTVQLRGKQGERWAAEILASMYDASLDQFHLHQWQRPDIYPTYPQNINPYRGSGWETGGNFQSARSLDRSYPDSVIPWWNKQYYTLLWESGGMGAQFDRTERVAMAIAAPPVADSAQNKVDVSKFTPSKVLRDEEIAGIAEEGAVRSALNEVVVTGITKGKSSGIPIQETLSPATRIRTDFRETAFFFPQLLTDTAGNVSFSFTMPDALTSWKAQIIAHTKDLALGYAVQQIVTQKELMVQPNAPRFLREGDQLVFPARITNMGDKEVSGQAELQVIDTETGQVVDGLFNNLFPTQFFTATPKQGTLVTFPLQVPGNFSKPLTYRIVAKTTTHSDGEEQTLPVLSNRLLVTESLPFFLKGPGTTNLSFDALKQSASSVTITHQSLTLELSTNPAWYAVQSLPYLVEYPYDCAEQVFNRFYGNVLAAHIANSKPAIRNFFSQWMQESAAGRDKLVSALEKNPELKSILLQESPWALDAKRQTEQLHQIGRLFDSERLTTDLQSALAKLEQAQTPNGGFAWFTGGPDDRYITQYIVTGIGKLQRSGAVPAAYQDRLKVIAGKGLTYMHNRILEDYEELKRTKADRSKQHLGPVQVQYLYASSFFPSLPVEALNLEAINYYRKQFRQFWLGQSRQAQAMGALALWRSGDAKTAQAILASLQQTAVKNEALGMYWKQSANPWYWQEAGLETQALLIEAFTEITKDEPSIARMKQWLLTQKQTSHWPSTRATADACYALLLRGSDWLASNTQATVTLGGSKHIDWKNDPSMEVGTGYRMTVIPGSAVSPSMGDIRVTLSDPSGASKGVPAWGAVYWQYFERLEYIRQAGGPLSVQKTIYRSVNTSRGPELQSLSEGDAVQVGDKLVVRMEIRADRDMEYVHLKDLRAAGTEPSNVLSGFQWQGRLGYYESTRDAATHFFFPSVPKGTYVLEYPLFPAQEGSYGAGPASLQCMYAPEFTAHSQGIRLKVRGR
jgi:uncharacterized protein YfaS (alpha-2-macroglobulin family)